MTEHWTKYRVIKNDTEGVEELSSKPDWVLRFNTALFVSFGFCQANLKHIYNYIISG